MPRRLVDRTRRLGDLTGSAASPNALAQPLFLLVVAFLLTAFAIDGEGAVRWDATGADALRAWLVLVVWAASIVVFVVAAADLEPSRGSLVMRMRRVRLPRAELVALVPLIVGALLIRTIALGRIPANFSGDEAGLGIFSREVLEGRWHDPFTTGAGSHPTLWFYVQALSLRVFGDGVVGLRLLTALIGVATVGALYLFARRLYGFRVALIAAVLLATYHFHVHFSRVGLNQATDALFALIGFGLALAGWQARSPLLLAASGVSIGVSQNFYYGTRLGVVVLLAFLGHQLLVSRSALAANARYLPLMTLGFMIGWGPGMRVPLYQWDDYNARLALVGIFESGWFDGRQQLGENPLHILTYQVLDAAGAITTVADRGPHYASGVPLLDPVSSVLFLTGIALLLYRWRRPDSALLLAWLVGALVFGGVLLVNPPEVQRFVTLAPVLCLLMALGIDAIGRALACGVPEAQRLVVPATAVTVAAIAVWNVNFYFREYSPRNSYGFRTTETATAIGRYLAAHPGQYVYFFGAPFAYVGDPSIRFLARDLPGLDVAEPLGPDGLPPPPAGLDPLVIFYAPRAGEAEEVRRRYPGSSLRMHRSEVDGAPMFAAYSPSPEGWR